MIYINVIIRGMWTFESLRLGAGGACKKGPNSTEGAQQDISRNHLVFPADQSRNSGCMYMLGNLSVLRW